MMISDCKAVHYMYNIMNSTNKQDGQAISMCIQLFMLKNEIVIINQHTEEHLPTKFDWDCTKMLKYRF